MNNEQGYERSGSQRRITSKRRGSAGSREHHQPTSSTAFYAQQGDEQSADLIRGMYDPAPNPYARNQTMSSDAATTTTS